MWKWSAFRDCSVLFLIVLLVSGRCCGWILSAFGSVAEVLKGITLLTEFNGGVLVLWFGAAPCCEAVLPSAFYRHLIN